MLLERLLLYSSQKPITGLLCYYLNPINKNITLILEICLNITFSSTKGVFHVVAYF